jgi:hypothetical protein
MISWKYFQYPLTVVTALIIYSIFNFQNIKLYCCLHLLITKFIFYTEFRNCLLYYCVKLNRVIHKICVNVVQIQVFVKNVASHVTFML